MPEPRSIAARTTEMASVDSDELSINVCVSYRVVTKKSAAGYEDALDGMPFRMSGIVGKVQHSADERVTVTVEEKGSDAVQTFELSLNAFRRVLELASRVGLSSQESPMTPIVRDYGHAVIPRYR